MPTAPIGEQPPNMSLQNLAPELVCMIFEELGHGPEGLQARVRLTATCKRLHTILLPKALETVRFSNDKRISDSALLAAQKHGIHIKALHFLGLDPILADSGVPDEAVARANRNHTIPYSSLLLFEAESSLLPSLQTFIIEFTNSGLAPRQGYRLPPTATPESLHKLWESTYSALTSNTTVSHLVISSWTPRLGRVQLSEKWWAYLGRLQTFDLTIADFVPRHLPLYYRHDGIYESAVIHKMDQIFFDHLSAAKTIKYSGSKRSFVGSFTKNQHLEYAIFPCGTGVLKSLVNLELSHIFISAQLIQFIRKQRDTLRSLVLKDMLATARLTAPRNNYDIALTWADFFKALSDTHGLTLTNLQFTSICPLDEQETRDLIRAAFPDPDVFGDTGGIASRDSDLMPNGGPPDGEDHGHQIASSPPVTTNKEGRRKKKKLFGYAGVYAGMGTGSGYDGLYPGLGTKYPNYHHPLNRRRFEEGEDLAAYEKLMELVEMNKSRR